MIALGELEITDEDAQVFLFFYRVCGGHGQTSVIDIKSLFIEYTRETSGWSPAWYKAIMMFKDYKQSFALSPPT